MNADDILDASLRPVSRTGERQLHRTNAFTWLTSINGFASQFRTPVPTSHWHGDDDRALVDCPCGQRQRVPVASVSQCGGCERIYLYSVKALLVANSPVHREVIPTS